jgi:hypothetical protein
VLDGLHYRIFDSTRQILDRLDEISRQIRGEDDTEIEDDSNTDILGIPIEVQDTFTILAQEKHPDLKAVPLADGLNAVVFYLDRTTRNPTRATRSEHRYHASVLSLMKAAWLLDITTDGNEYEEACQYRSSDGLENQLMTWGMTVERFAKKLEDVCSASGVSVEAMH